MIVTILIWRIRIPLTKLYIAVFAVTLHYGWLPLAGAFWVPKSTVSNKLGTYINQFTYGKAVFLPISYGFRKLMKNTLSASVAVSCIARAANGRLTEMLIVP